MKYTFGDEKYTLTLKGLKIHFNPKGIKIHFNPFGDEKYTLTLKGLKIHTGWPAVGVLVFICKCTSLRC